MNRVLSLSILLLALAVLMAVLRRPAPDPDPVVESVAQEAPAPAETDTHRVLTPAECARAGYLCSGLRQRDEPRVLRWPDATSAIVVLVPAPTGIPSGRARELQRAAARGIRAWQGRPFPIRVDLAASGTGPDVTVGWVESLAGAELGRVETRWLQQGGSASFVVDRFTLATSNPFDAGRGLTPAELTLSAAHEMGHVLGLPHSDSPSDLMYPTNTAARLTTEDFRTLEALYRLPNGALLELGAVGR